jgi:hypothetical protein
MLGVVGTVGVEVGIREQNRQAAARDAGAGTAHPEVDPPRPIDEHAAVAVGSQRVGLVEVDDGRLAAGGAA